VAALLFFSGLCALVYQTVWMREFRLVFGASTSATAAVLAIFMGGLGIGSALFGKKADTRDAPLALYAKYEFIIAVSAALSLPLLWIVRQVYLSMGGSVQLGLFAATAVRLLLAAVVLAIPTLAMGGTLPAAARAVETDSDTARRNLALLYGMNTLGAVAGTLLSTFFMLETFGNRKTLLIAALLNLLVAVVARSMSKWSDGRLARRAVDDSAAETAAAPLVPAPLILLTAALVGFAFLLMELVWYRMLGPLLGGTTFTFGLILATALLGIGAGSFAYSLWNRATLGGLALTTALEALAVVIPFALGDRIAILANVLRRLGDLGFGGHILGWSAITFIVVFPAAFIAGIQFPLLIALLGRGTENVGKHVGLAYAWNTAGAIAGSLAGGFGLLPLLSAPGAWRAVTVILVLTGLMLAIAGGLKSASTLSLGIGAAAALMLFASGPTALWRHSGIGVGRLPLPDSTNASRAAANDYRRRVLWDADGRESSVALLIGDDISMIVNGKSDGSATGDAGTQVMGGLIGALLHGSPRSALVVGLGTGSTAGWLASVPSMQRVDVVELEAVASDVAKACSAVNQDVLRRRNVRIDIADAREVLLATPNRYDIIFSEPSNPYRAGIASLFTTEFYQAAAARLSANGIFLQWVQAYGIDAATMRTIYATIGGVFPNVQTYWTTYGDLVLVATAQPLHYDAGRLRGLLLTEPYRSAIQRTWRVATLEGVLSHFVGNEKTAQLLSSQAEARNTDDRTVIEFSFARAVHMQRSSLMVPLILLARERGEDRPLRMTGAVDWNAANINRLTVPNLPFPTGMPSADAAARHQFSLMHSNGDLAQAAAVWREASWRPVNIAELTAAGESLAEVADERSVSYAQTIAGFQRAEAEAVMARLRMQQNRYADAADHVTRALTSLRRDPWPARETMRRAIETAIILSRSSKAHAPAMYEALRVPFAAGQLDSARRSALVTIAAEFEGCGRRTIDALSAFEPHVPWRRDHLVLRVRCYGEAGMGELAKRAREELEEFEEAEAEPLNTDPSGAAAVPAAGR
jgi:predicted membrane-bound spermidine synthase